MEFTARQQDLMDKLAAYGLGVYSIPGGFAVADPTDDEDGWFLATHFVWRGPEPYECEATLDEILVCSCENIAVTALEGPLENWENDPA
jgi:hypothetical protein